MSNNQQQPKSQLTLQKDIETFRSEFDELVRQEAPKFEVDAYADFTKSREETSQLADQLKKQANDIKQTYSPLTSLAQIPIIHHRLQIAREIQNLYALHERFNSYYSKNTNDRTILDILQYIKFFYKMNVRLEKFSKIAICDKINEDINNKIQKTGAIIIETIQHIGYENLSITDIFQLIIISSSPEQFLSFFNFLDDKLFEIKNFSKFNKYIQIHHNFHEKIKKVALIFKANRLKDFIKNYMRSIEKEKAEFEAKVISTYQDSLNAHSNNLYIEDLLTKIDQCSQLTEQPYFSENFKDTIKKLINNLILSLAKIIYNIKSENIKNKKNYLDSITRSIKHLQTKYSSESPEFSKYPQNLEKIFLNDFASFYHEDKSSIDILMDISASSISLFNLVFENKIKIKSFRQLLINIVNIQLRTIKIIMMKRFSPPEVLKNMKHYRNTEIPASIDNFFLKDDIPESNNYPNYMKLIAITIYGNYHEILQKSNTQLFSDNRIFDSKFYEICCHVFYDIDLMTSENDFHQITEKTAEILFEKTAEITNIPANKLKEDLMLIAAKDFSLNKKGDNENGLLSRLKNITFK